MQIQSTLIQDTFAEAFRMWACRLIITAADKQWALTAAQVVTGYGTSVIGCDTEAGIERFLTPSETPDARPGVSVMFFAFNAEKLAKAIPNRVGQCLMTCPTIAAYDGLPNVTPTEDSARLDLGKKMRFFGDGNQKSKVLAGRRYWRVPIMEGEFLVEESFGAVKAIGGGNLLICGTTQPSALKAAQAAVKAIQSSAASAYTGVIMPFPGGIVRSGSKVGSRYKGMFASTNDEYCPTLAGRPRSKLSKAATSVYEIVINGLDKNAIANAMRIGMQAAAGPGTAAISAGNYGGNLGKFHFKLHEILNTNSGVPSAQPAQPASEKPASSSATLPIPSLTLTYKKSTPKSRRPLDGSFLIPEKLLALPPDQLAAFQIQTLSGPAPLADLFDITHSEASAPGGIHVHNLPILDLVGQSMAVGSLTIHGSTGHLTGASMSGGTLRILGSTGDKLGGPALGTSGGDRGMTGGTIFVSKNTGAFAGQRMRRGIILIQGSAGLSPGYRMLAGTIIIGAGTLAAPGLEMRRGTIMALQGHPITNPQHLSKETDIQPDACVALGLILNHARSLGLKVNPKLFSSTWSLFSGDTNELNRGEVWTPMTSEISATAK
jgi:formylmethanofuran--tetrahydromethanopterin N-formyltransferase